MNEAGVGLDQSVNSTETDGVLDPSGKVPNDNIVHLPDHLKGVYRVYCPNGYLSGRYIDPDVRVILRCFAESDFDLGNFTAI